MRSAFSKGVLRSISHSLGRFLAIAIIVGLGTGFYAGLRMTAPDMKLAGDMFYDGTNLADLRVMSTLGLTDDDVNELREVEGVEGAFGAYETDVLATIESTQYTIRIHSLDTDAARASDTSDGVNAISDDINYINRPILVEGEWPDEAGECVLSADTVNDGEIALGDTVSVFEGTQDIDETLDYTEYVVVGFVSSSYYVSGSSMGTTSLGSGSIDQYMYISEDDFADDLPYSEVFVTVEGAKDLLYSSEEYDELVAHVAQLIEDLGPQMNASRLDEVKGEAQSELDDAWEEYENERSDVEAQLADAEAELEDAKAQLDDAITQITDGQAEIDDGWTLLEESAAELSSAREQLASSADQIAALEVQLADGQSQYEEGLSELNQQKDEVYTQIDAAQNQIDQAREALETRSQLQSQLDQVNAALAAIDMQVPDISAALQSAQEGVSQASQAISAAQQAYDDATAYVEAAEKNYQEASEAVEAATPGSSEYDALVEAQDTAQKELEEAQNAQTVAAAALTQAQSALDEAQNYVDALTELQSQRNQLVATASQLESGIAQIDQQLDGTTSASLDAAQSALDAQRASADRQFAQAQATLDASKAQLNSGWSQLASAKQAYSQGLAEYQDGLAQYESGRAELEAAEATLADARAEYEEGLAEYEEGLAEYEEQKAQAEEEFADAEEELADTQSQIDDISDPEWYVLDRSKIVGVASFESDANRIDQIAQVFPFIFFLVAALVSLTTMTRMVEEERVLMGTYKALGYSNARIASRYLIYALVAGGVGSLVGIVALSMFLPYLIMEAYSVVYAVPPRPTPINFNLALLSAGLGIGITLAATYFAVVSALRETPAALMLPRAPKAGKRILLERIRPLWERMSFSWKVTARNLFRYKRRFFMAIIGIAGCTALLLTGLGLQNAINDIIDKQFGEIYHYSMTVRMEDDISDDDRAAVMDVMDDTLRIDGYTLVATANMIALSDAQEEESTDQRFELVIPQDFSTLQDYVTVRERVGHTSIDLSDGGVVISEKLASVLEVSEGDTIRLYEEDIVGNASGEGYDVTVAGIMENYVSQYVFMAPSLYERVFGEEPVYSTIYAKSTDDESVREQMSEELLAIEGVSTVGYNDETISSYRTMLQSVDSVVVVLIVAAALLAFVVLYNLTNINITERAREIATLKVLGFTPHEVNAYIYRETLLLSGIGALVGVFLGVWMESFVVVTAEVDQVMFGREIHPSSFALALVLTMAFSVIVTVAMRRKLARIDMVESLKSVE